MFDHICGKDIFLISSLNSSDASLCHSLIFCHWSHLPLHFSSSGSCRELQWVHILASSSPCGQPKCPQSLLWICLPTPSQFFLLDFFKYLKVLITMSRQCSKWDHISSKSGRRFTSFDWQVILFSASQNTYLGWHDKLLVHGPSVNQHLQIPFCRLALQLLVS